MHIFDTWKLHYLRLIWTSIIIDCVERHRGARFTEDDFNMSQASWNDEGRTRLLHVTLFRQTGESGEALLFTWIAVLYRLRALRLINWRETRQRTVNMHRMQRANIVCSEMSSPTHFCPFACSVNTEAKEKLKIPLVCMKALLALLRLIYWLRKNERKWQDNERRIERRKMKKIVTHK